MCLPPRPSSSTRRRGARERPRPPLHREPRTGSSDPHACCRTARHGEASVLRGVVATCPRAGGRAAEAEPSRGGLGAGSSPVFWEAPRRRNSRPLRPSCPSASCPPPRPPCPRPELDTESFVPAGPVLTGKQGSERTALLGSVITVRRLVY